MGVWRPLASIRCSTPEHPGGGVELVYHRACRRVPRGGALVSVWAINLDCRVGRTFPLEPILETDGPCGNFRGIAHEIACAPIAGYLCTVWDAETPRVTDFNARCVDEQTRLRALEIYYAIPRELDPHIQRD